MCHCIMQGPSHMSSKTFAVGHTEPLPLPCILHQCLQCIIQPCAVHHPTSCRASRKYLCLLLLQCLSLLVSHSVTSARSRPQMLGLPKGFITTPSHGCCGPPAADVCVLQISCKGVVIKPLIRLKCLLVSMAACDGIIPLNCSG